MRTTNTVWIVTHGERPPRAFRTKTRAIAYAIAQVKRSKKRWPTLWRQELESGEWSFEPTLLGYWMPRLEGYRWNGSSFEEDGPVEVHYDDPVFIPAHDGKKSMAGDIWMFYRIGELRKDP